MNGLVPLARREIHQAEQGLMSSTGVWPGFWKSPSVNNLWTEIQYQLGLMKPDVHTIELLFLCRSAPPSTWMHRDDRRSIVSKVLSIAGGRKPRRTGESDLTHPLLGDQPTLQLLPPRDEIVGKHQHTIKCPEPWAGKPLHHLTIVHYDTLISSPY